MITHEEEPRSLSKGAGPQRAEKFWDPYLRLYGSTLTRGEGACFRGSGTTLISRGGDPTPSNFWDLLYIRPTIRYTQQPNAAW